MCVGRSQDQAFDIVMDALPTALGCDLVYLRIPGFPERERASLRGAPLSEEDLAEVRAAIAADADGTEAQVFLGAGRLWCLEAEVPMGTERGRLLTGSAAPLDPETDRVRVRSAANIVGATLETAKVLEAARRKDDFLAMLGHELRNPLAPIVTAVELLRRNPSVAREQKVLDRHTRHLARIVDDLLDISRAARGHLELRQEQISLASVLERAVEIAGPIIAEHRHALAVASGEAITVRGDPVRLAQIFGNLLTNAAKFTPPGGRIDVLVEPVPGRVRVTVRDNGRGIASDQLRRIFEPFVQAERKEDALQGGLGLGLAIVSTLVERHGGTVAVRSDGPGQGASFTVDLPTETRAAHVPDASQPQASATRAGVRVLIVDDTVDIAELLCEALRDEGFETALAHDGQGAIDRWRDFSPHAAILDVGLPVVDGYELARAIRLEHGSVPFLIAATGYGQEKDRARALHAGFDCHFAKPVSISQLVLALDQHVVGGARTAAAGAKLVRPDG
jgi:signal transduction histidine kinase/ActR/RegA family two-component response regulator